ncbi:hypothetical protein G6F35_018781 [Rhizopus arrhizus]|nr:hypothetical protein G6F35_018781 [Rhizopus arrhizus]
MALMQLHVVAGHCHHALDEAGAIGRRVEHRHFAALRAAGRHQFLAGERQAQAIGTHVHHHPVAGLQGRLHRATGHHVVVGQGIARGGQQAEQHQQRQ